MTCFGSATAARDEATAISLGSLLTASCLSSEVAPSQTPPFDEEMQYSEAGGLALR